MDSLWTLENITPTDGMRYKAIDSSISQDFSSYIKMLSMHCRKNIREFKITKKRMSIASYTDI